MIFLYFPPFFVDRSTSFITHRQVSRNKVEYALLLSLFLKICLTRRTGFSIDPNLLSLPPKTGKSGGNNPGADSTKGEAQEKPVPEKPNKGTLKVDATVAPQHAGYPTDTRLLAQARQYSEAPIDKLYKGGLWKKKPRTYRRKAHKEYLGFAKMRSPKGKAIKKARGKQLRYLCRNLKTISKMLDKLEAAGIKHCWAHNDWRRFWVIQ